MRVLSGIQPTGNLHLGNYLGAIRNMVNMQEKGECYFFLADLHAITAYNDPGELYKNILEIAAALIASGVDPDKATLFNQSRVSAHPELAWLLIANTPLGWLDRMTQFKEKSGKHKQRASLGLYSYPVLQAADILLYQATHVPVGEDQKQHLELTRDIANKFNNDFGRSNGPVFTVPEPYISPVAARIMSLRDANEKMSKSNPSDLSRINLRDDDDMILRKIKKAKTDPEPLPDNAMDLEGRAEALNLVNIYAALDNSDKDTVLRQFAGRGFGDFKPALADLLIAHINPIRHRLEKLLADTGAIHALLEKGAERARTAAGKTVEAAYHSMGLHR